MAIVLEAWTAHEAKTIRIDGGWNEDDGMGGVIGLGDGVVRARYQ
jgi:hypothetical protein